MKDFLQENCLKTGALLLATLISGGLFYWFQLRPAEIKRGCSWVEKHTEAIPEVTQSDIDKAKVDATAMKKARESEGETSIQSIVEWKLSRLAAESPHPVISSKTSYVPADPAEYSFCLHSHGL